MTFPRSLAAQSPAWAAAERISAQLETEQAIRPVYVVNVTAAKLSPEAIAYLRRIVAMMRRDGSPAATAAEYACIWCGGYKAFAAGKPHPCAAHAAYIDGWEFGHGEDQYNEAMRKHDEFMAVRESMMGAW